MDALDLRATPPRSPHEKLAGLRMLARTVDKARAMLPGGECGPYWLTPGLSEWLLGKLHIGADELLDVVRDARSDEDVAVFVRSRNDDERLAKIDAALGSLTVAQVSDDLRELFVRAYGVRPPDQLLLDVLAEDDRAPYRNRVTS